MPSELIVVSALVNSKWPKVKTIQRSYNLSNGVVLENFEVGLAYDIDYTSRKVPGTNGKPDWEARDIVAARLNTKPVEKTPTTPQKQAETPQIAANGAKNGVIPQKEVYMAKMSALRASVDMVTAYVELVKGRMDQDLNLTELETRQKKYYSQFLSDITGDIPF